MTERESVPIERLQEAVHAAADILANNVNLPGILAHRAATAGRKPHPDAARVLLERLGLAEKALGLDLKGLARIRGKDAGIR